MSKQTDPVAELIHEFRLRAGNRSDNLGAELAWNTAADLLADALQQQRYAAARRRLNRKASKLGLRMSR
ncbi:hypothetical protein [Haloferula sargassicola]|uniref:Uncharacterized protein n=1 Tax=Haloferula sargassicola TaxID=490096 RepID=A0ABP9UPZ3_9BACT